MSLPTTSPDANYLARDNIVYPRGSNAAELAAAEARARADIQARQGGVTVTGGTIKKER